MKLFFVILLAILVAFGGLLWFLRWAAQDIDQ